MKFNRVSALFGVVSAAALVVLSGCGGGGSDFDSPSFTLGGTLTGLAANDSVQLSDGHGTTITLSQNGTYQISPGLQFNGRYVITIAQQPAGQVCSIANGTGAGVTANVGNVNVSCSTTTFAIGGTVTGLAEGATVVLADNGSDTLSVAANGGFSFNAPVNYNGAYSVTVASQPSSQVCTVGNGTGLGLTANVANVAVTCQARTFPVSGTVSGLQAGTQLTLMNNGADPQVVTGNGGFAFGSPVSYGSSYAVTVNQQPFGQACSISQGTGSQVVAPVTGVVVNCASSAYSVGGTVAGLASGAQLTLFDNGGDALVVSANGSFTFASPIVPGGMYGVTINQQPANQVCSVSAGVASASANVTNVAVTCVTSNSIGGTVTGLASGAQLTLLDNGGDALVIGADGSFVFPTWVAPGGRYAVTIDQQPVGQACAVASGAGTASANVGNIAVTCVSTYSVGGTMSGLPAGARLALSDNGSDSLTVSADGSFVFATAISVGSPYSVTIATQPAGATCAVANPGGVMGNANVSNISVTCITPAQMLPLLKFTQNQIADAQWNVGACTTTNTCVVNSTSPGVAYMTPFTRGRFDWAACGAGAQMVFEENIVNGAQDPTNPYAENLYNAGGNLCQAGGTGHFVIAGRDAQNTVYLFYVGSDNNTGSLVSPRVQLTGAGVTFTGTSKPDIVQLYQYLSGP